MNLSIRKISTITAAAALVLLVAWYLVLWSPGSKHLATAHKQHAAAELQVTQLDSQVGQLEALVRQIPADTAKLKTFQAMVTDNPSLDTALHQIDQAAKSSGVAVASVGPSAPAGVASSAPGQSSSQANPGVPSITVSMTATGSHQALMTFLTNLSTLPRVVVVNSLALTGANPQAATIGAQIFYAGSPTP